MVRCTPQSTHPSPAPLKHPQHHHHLQQTCLCCRARCRYLFVFVCRVALAFTSQRRDFHLSLFHSFSHSSRVRLLITCWGDLKTWKRAAASRALSGTPTSTLKSLQELRLNKKSGQKCPLVSFLWSGPKCIFFGLLRLFSKIAIFTRVQGFDNKPTCVKRLFNNLTQQTEAGQHGKYIK